MRSGLSGEASTEALLARLSAAGRRPRQRRRRACRRCGRFCSCPQQTSAGAHLRLDPSLARGLSYYTGAIFEIAVDGIGSLGGGGRYDNLVGMFSSESVPACGFSLGLERILVVMSERGMFPPEVTRAGADVLATVWNAEALADTLALARLLRAAGLRVEVYPDADKIGKQMKYASSRGVRFATIVGDDERAAGTVMVKDLTTGEQTPVARGEVAAWLTGRLAIRVISFKSAICNLQSSIYVRVSRLPLPHPHLRRAAPADVGADVVLLGVGPSRPRSRRAAVPRRARPSRRHAGDGPQRQPADGRRQEAPLRVRRRRAGAGPAA